LHAVAKVKSNPIECILILDAARRLLPASLVSRAAVVEVDPDVAAYTQEYNPAL